MGWDLVPRTWLRGGPRGPGMVQVWREPDPTQEAVTIVPAGEVPDGWHHVLDGLDAQEHVVSLVHEDSTKSFRRDGVIRLGHRGSHVPDPHEAVVPDE